MIKQLSNFTDILGDEIANSQPLSLPSSTVSEADDSNTFRHSESTVRPTKGTGQRGVFRSVDEIDSKYRNVFSYPYFNLIQSRVIDDALYSDKSMVVCAPTGSGKTVIFEMAIVQLLMAVDDMQWKGDFKIIYMAPVKSLCTERLTEWYPKFTKLGLNCIEVTGDTDVDFSRLGPYKIIITTPEKWDILTRRWRDHRGLVEMIKLFLIDEVHILNDESRGPVLEAVVSRMKTIQESAQSAHRLEQLTKQYENANTDMSRTDNPYDNSSSITHRNDNPRAFQTLSKDLGPMIRFVAVSATVSNPEDVADWLSSTGKSAVFYKFGDESRPVKLRRVVEGYPCPEGTSIFKFDIILNYKLWPIIQKYHDGKPTLIFCNTRKSVSMTAEMLSKELTISFSPEQKAKLVALASTIKNKKLQSLVLSGVGCHHAGLLYEERVNIENSFRNRELPILITTTTLAMGVNLPAHLVIVKNTQQYVNGAYQEYSISTVLQMVGRAGRPQFDTEATAVIMTTLKDKPRYQSLVGGSDPLQSYLHKRLTENLNSEAALGTVTDVAQCVQWLRSTFLYVRAGKNPRRYLGLPQNAPAHQITKKIEELCVKAMNSLATSGLITMDEASCIESTEAGKLMSVYYLDVETMKHIMKVNGTETLDQLLWLICESHELSDNHLRMDERRILNSLNRNNKAATIRFPMKGKITTRQMKLNCIIQAVLGCLPISEPSLNQEAMKIMRTAERVCKCLVAYVTRSDLISTQPKYFTAILNSIVLNKCISSHLWENSQYVSKQLKGIGPTFSTLLATAGKTSFLLLEESHPRDLERIMNKGPPAGNMIRKQIALLPKYQLTTTPVDKNTVSIKLLLLNHAYLYENIDNLTAGVHHRSYVIVGDSNNHLLLLTSFKDKDLIGMYDGTMTYEISRQQSSEHKIIVHCVSSVFVGIDVHCEYVFKGIEPLFHANDEHIYPPFESELPATPRLIQPSIADIFQERKRKNNKNITRSKEKIKRDCSLVEKFKQLKDSFAVTSKALKKDSNHSSELSNSIICEFTDNNSSIFPTSTIANLSRKGSTGKTSYIKDLADFTDLTLPCTDITMDDIDYIDLSEDDPISNATFNNILNDIEKEIHRKSSVNSMPSTSKIAVVNKDKGSCYSHTSIETKDDQIPTKQRKLSNSKSNYHFIDKIAERNDVSDDEDKITKTGNGLSDTVKTYIENYLQKQSSNNTDVDYTMPNLVNQCQILKNTDRSNTPVVEKEELGASKLISKTENVIKGDSKKENENQVKRPDTISCKISEEDVIEINDYPELLNKKTEEHLIRVNHELTNDCNESVIEISDLDEDITQLATQKILSLPASPDEKHLIDESNEADPISAKDNQSQTLGANKNSEKDLSFPFVEITNNNDSNTIEKRISLSNSYCVVPQTERKNLAEESHTSSEKKPVQDLYHSENNIDSRFHENYPFYNNSSYPQNIIKTPGQTENKEQTHINKYSFSRTNIDVSTKKLPDRQICVVKKVRVDLDVTEIISKKSDSYENVKNDLELAFSEDFENDFSEAKLCISNQTQKYPEETSVPNKLINLQNIEFPNGQKCITFQNTCVSSGEDKSTLGQQIQPRISGKLKTSDLKNAEAKPNHIALNLDITGNKNNSETVEEKTANCFEERLENVADAKQLPSAEDQPKEKSTIANILQKYTKLFQGQAINTTAMPDESKEETTNQLLEEHERSKKKTKRQYKISDIQNNKVPLPDYIYKIISSKPPLAEKSDSQILMKEPVNLKSNNFLDTCDEIYKTRDSLVKLNSSANFMHKIDEDIDEINKLRSEFGLQVDPDVVEVNEESAMLDPKTLLQSLNQNCLENGDIIIPPPLEFSENVDSKECSDLNLFLDNIGHNSPCQNKYPADTDSDSYNFKMYRDSDINADPYSPVRYFKPSTLIKTKPFDLNETPEMYSNNEHTVEDQNKTFNDIDVFQNKDVETWTLSRENSFEEPSLYDANSRPSINMAQGNTFSQPENFVNRLKSFKFTPKTQLKRNSRVKPLSQQACFKRNWTTVRRNRNS